MNKNNLDYNIFGYLIVFIKDKTNYCYLANNISVDDICYSKLPYFLGTSQIEFAKCYDSIESAKTDIYKLRYYHREFLKFSIGIKKINKTEIFFRIATDVKKYELS